MRVDKYKAIFERDRLSEYLPYWTYEDGIYHLKDGGMGFIFECRPLFFLNEQVKSGLISVLATVPQEASCQFLLVASSNITPVLDRWASGKVRNQDIVEDFKQFIEEKSIKPISTGFPATLKDFRVFFSLKLYGKQQEEGLFSSFKSIFGGDNHAPQITEETFKRRVEYTKEVKGKIDAALKAAFLVPVEATPEVLVPLLYGILNPGHDPRYPMGYYYDPLSENLISNDTRIEVYDDHLVIDGYFARNLNIKAFPEYFDIYNIWRYIGDIFSNIAFKGQFLIALNFTKLNDKAKAKVRRSASIVLAQKMPYALFPKLKYKHEDLSYGMDRIERGQDLYEVDMDIMLLNKDKVELDEMTELVKSHWRVMGFRLEPDLYINLPMLLLKFPLTYDRTSANFLRRSKVVFEENVATLAPVFGGWKGAGAEMLFVSPTGQLIGFDLFNNPAGGYNSFVIGMTGSGKSVFLQYLALNYLLSGNRVWIIDIGRSYERFCHNFDGEFIELKLDNPLCLNPFSSIESIEMLDEYLEFLISLFLLMGGSKSQEMAARQEKVLRAHLTDAIRKAYEKYGSESSIEAVVSELEGIEDDRVKDFVVSMAPYRTTGQFGIFFNGKADITFHSPLVVMENDTIENLPDLRDPCIMLLTYHIMKNVYLQHGRQKNVVIIDEAHKFLGNPKINLFMEQAYRRFRKHGASMIIGTQGFEDIWRDGKSDVGRVIIENSFWKMFLMQTSTSRNSLKKSERLTLSNYEERLMDTTRTLAGEYSEVFICSENGSEKVRLILSDLMKAMFFTNPEIRAKINELVKQGMSYKDAVREVQKLIGGNK